MLDREGERIVNDGDSLEETRTAICLLQDPFGFVRVVVGVIVVVFIPCLRLGTAVGPNQIECP